MFRSLKKISGSCLESVKKVFERCLDICYVFGRCLERCLKDFWEVYQTSADSVQEFRSCLVFDEAVSQQLVNEEKSIQHLMRIWQY